MFANRRLTMALVTTSAMIASSFMLALPSGASEATVVNQEEHIVSDWNAATTSAHDKEYSQAKSEYQAGLAYYDDIGAELSTTSDSPWAREAYLLISPLQPIVEAYVTGVQAAPPNLDNNSVYEAVLLGF